LNESRLNAVLHVYDLALANDRYVTGGFVDTVAPRDFHALSKLLAK
jgi:hypothetical protein